MGLSRRCSRALPSVQWGVVRRHQQVYLTGMCSGTID